MSNAVIQWTPAGGANSLSQDVKYKKKSDAGFTLFGNVGPGVNTATITGLLDNVVYQFMVSNVCAYGGPTPSAQYEGVLFTCPAVNMTPSHNLVSYNFTHLGGDIDKYVVELLNASGSGVIATNQHTAPSGTISGSFTGLNPSTAYKIRVTVYAGTYSKICPANDFSTAAAPVCDAPTNVTATLS
jgi:hypothetical protein